MRKLSAHAGMALLLIALASGFDNCVAGSRTLSLSQGTNRQITTQDAKKIEESLASNPDDLSAREKLIEYYFEAALTTRTAENEEKREQHILWLIEHHPEAELAGSPQAEIMPIGSTGSTDAYQ